MSLQHAAAAVCASIRCPLHSPRSPAPPAVQHGALPAGATSQHGAFFQTRIFLSLRIPQQVAQLVHCAFFSLHKESLAPVAAQLCCSHLYSSSEHLLACCSNCSLQIHGLKPIKGVFASLPNSRGVREQLCPADGSFPAPCSPAAAPAPSPRGAGR